MNACYKMIEWYRSIYGEEHYFLSYITFPQATEVTAANYVMSACVHEHLYICMCAHVHMGVLCSHAHISVR